MSNGKSLRERERELKEHPFFKQKYLDAFDKMLKEMPEETRNWKTAEDVYNWWLNDKIEKQIEGQEEMNLNE